MDHDRENPETGSWHAGPSPAAMLNEEPTPDTYAPPLSPPQGPYGGPVAAHTPPPFEKGARRRPHWMELALFVLALAVAVALLVQTALSVFLLGTAGSWLSSLTATYTHASPPENSFSVISVVGTIQDSGGGAYGINEPSYLHRATLHYIGQLTEDEGNRGILLNMNTGGGGVYESDELYRALMAYKEATGRPVWAYMGAICASGGYYVCMAADTIIANYNSTTGSIGVYIALTDTSGLYDLFGVRTVLVRSGENKGIGANGVPITDEQAAIYQSMVDESYERFLSLVVAGREMDPARARTLADGRPYTASQALANGLVDDLSDWDTTVAAFEAETGATSYTPNFSQRTFLGSLVGAVEDLLPKSDAEAVLQQAEELPSGVPLAWAPGLAA